MSPPPGPSFTLDHVEFFVPDRVQAAEWYERVLGCRPVPGSEQWAPFGHHLEVTTYEADLVRQARGVV